MASIPADFRPLPNQLKLFAPEEIEQEQSEETEEAEDDGCSAEMPLSAFYAAHVRPICLQKAAKRNLDQYDETLGPPDPDKPDKPKSYWVRFTGDPSLNRITAHTCAKFVAAVKQLPGRTKGEPLSPNTVRKHCTAVQFVLDRAGPRTRRKADRNNRGLLREPPLVDKPDKVIDEVEDAFTVAEIGLLLDACHAATVPCVMGCRPAEWWQSLVLVAYNVGLRIGTLLRLQFNWLEQDELGTWLRVPARAMKGGKRGRRLFVNQWAAMAIERLRPPAEAPRDLIFPWVSKKQLTEGYLHSVRREEILAASGIAPARRFGFHGLRKAQTTELGKINGFAAAVVSAALGHASGSRSVAIDHYAHRSVMAEALKQLPQPKWHPDRDGQQVRLFE